MAAASEDGRDSVEAGASLYDEVLEEELTVTSVESDSLVLESNTGQVYVVPHTWLENGLDSDIITIA